MAKVCKFVDMVLVEPEGLKCYAVNKDDRFCGFVFALCRDDALDRVKDLGDGYVLVGYGFGVTYDLDYGF